MLKNQVSTKGDLSNAWWRSMRVLFEEGRPFQPHVRIFAEPTANGSSPFGVLGKTRIGSTDRYRLIFWPPLPKGLPEPTAEHPHIITDHITLELWSRKSHPTWYRHDGDSASPDESRGWKLRQVDNQGFSHWFTMIIQHSVINEQGYEVEANVNSPSVQEKERRTAEYVKHVQSSQAGRIELPPLPHVGNYVCCNFFVRTDDRPMDYRGLVGFIERLPLWHHVTVDESCNRPSLSRGSQIVVDGTEVVVVTACPGGAVEEKCVLAVSATPEN